MRLFKYLIGIQAGYYLVTALLAIFDIDIFMKITGPKTDIWLVKTTGAMIIAISVTLGSYLFMHRDRLPAIILGSISALAFTIIDFYYASTGAISSVYMLDGVFETALLLCWGSIIVRSYIWRRDNHETANQPVKS